MATIAWDRLLETIHRRRATLALLNVGSPPLLRIDEDWRVLQVPALGRDDIAELVAERFAVEGSNMSDGYASFDFWFGDVAFFQVMAFGYPNSVSLVVSRGKATRAPS